MPNICRYQYPKLTYSRGLTQTPNPSDFERHCHGTYELLYVIRGRGKYMVDGVEYPLRDNTVLLLRPCEFHYVCPDKDYPYDRVVSNFSRDALLDTAANLPFFNVTGEHKNGVYFSEESVTDAVKDALHEIERLAPLFSEDPVSEELMARMAISRALLLLSLSEPEKAQPERETLVVQVIEYINQRLKKDISLEKLAQHFFVSKYYLCHAFRKYTGVSILTYINTKRIAMAQQMLANGEPATSVAYHVGYHSYSSFYRAYCAQVGEPPVRRRTTEERERSMLQVRLATKEELAIIEDIYANARAYMREHGNPEQWKNNYPSRALIEQDLERGHLHVCICDREIYGVFCYFKGDDPTYAVIEDGSWQNTDPYGVIHRIAVAKHGCGVAAACFDYAFSQCGNLKIDTHRDNLPMQRALQKNGFVRCGIIHLENGEERMAFQKVQ